MTITTTIEVRAVVTVVESPGQTGARQADGAPLEPSLEREAHIQSVELPDAEGVGLRWRKELPTTNGIWLVAIPQEYRSIHCGEIEVIRVVNTNGVPVRIHRGIPGGIHNFVTSVRGLQFLGPIQPNVATPSHLPVDSLSPTDAQRIMRLAEREEIL